MIRRTALALTLGLINPFNAGTAHFPLMVCSAATKAHQRLALDIWETCNGQVIISQAPEYTIEISREGVTVHSTTTSPIMLSWDQFQAFLMYERSMMIHMDHFVIELDKTYTCYDELVTKALIHLALKQNEIGISSLDTLTTQAPEQTAPSAPDTGE